MTLQERNAKGQLAKWTKRAATACGEVPPGVPPPTTHRPEHLEASWRCSLCTQEARTLGGLGIFCRDVVQPGAVQAPAPLASQDIRRFFAVAGAGGPPGRPPEAEPPS